MKFTSEQLRDLILLSREGCFTRGCDKCIWWGQPSQEDEPKLKGVRALKDMHRCLFRPMTSFVEIKEKAKKIIQQIIGNEIHS